jgi:DNA-binding CsgD family transcriptional regulator
MYNPSKIPWMKINDFLLDIGNIRDPKEFCVQVLDKIYPLIPFDQARIYFLNESGKICDEVLYGVEKRWSDVYREYYSILENCRYSISTIIENGFYSIPNLMASVYNWGNYECDEFITDYIKPQGLNHSIGFGFHNANSFIKCAYTLDRTSKTGYTHEEIDLLNVIQPHLDNLHMNLFVLALKNNTFIKKTEVQNPLTKRESELAELLCNGMTPTRISKQLFISLPTVYRHIANIHEKLNVSNRQELLLKLMSIQDPKRS